MDSWRERQAEAVALLWKLNEEWEPTTFEKTITIRSEFTGSDACGICGRQWGKSGMHICAPVDFREAYADSLANRSGVTALVLEALWRWRVDYLEGHEAWKKGRELRYEVTGEAKRDHEKYVQLTEAIEEFERNLDV